MISTAQLSKLSPLAKLSLWALGVVLIAGLLQLAAIAVGADFSLTSKSSGGTAIILIAFALLLAMMAVESRPLADYGLVADKGWRRRALTGAAMGAGIYALYSGVAWWQGLVVLRPDLVSISRALKATLAAASAAPVAVTGQIIFSGYLLTTLRDRHSRPAAVLLPAVLFALAVAATCSGGIASAQGGRLFVGILLVQSLLGLLRLRTGSIVIPAGVLAGAIMVRKASAKSRFVGYDWDSADIWWLAPGGDARQGVLMWGVLAIAILAVGVSLCRHGEKQLDADTQGDASFKRYMPFSNLLGLATFDRWLVLLWQSRYRIGVLYLPRLVVSLIGSIGATLLALPERLIAPLLLKKPAPAPVFIVGMPRSGTTHLHNLLALDPQFRSPRNYEVFNPHGFLTGWLTTALLTPFMTWRRPMDSVQMTVASAQEEEFALAAMGSPSPYWGFCLPREIDRHDRYWHPEGFSASEKRRWQQHYELFLRKLTCWRRRTPLLKNPANTGRVAMLKELFPGAKFIHIVRHPHAVWQSNQRLAEHGLAVFQLQDHQPGDNYATRSLTNYRRLMDAYYDDTASLDGHDVAEIRFEDLEDAPLAAVRALYRQLGMTPSAEFEARLKAYLDRVSEYRKNRFPSLPESDCQAIDTAMAPYLSAWGYAQEPDRRAA